MRKSRSGSQQIALSVPSSSSRLINEVDIQRDDTDIHRITHKDPYFKDDLESSPIFEDVEGKDKNIRTGSIDNGRGRRPSNTSFEFKEQDEHEAILK